MLELKKYRDVMENDVMKSDGKFDKKLIAVWKMT